ncbi:MAG: hypothetical protein VKI81_06330 [Synechococcaceae cyanobacterium]|nr:hypothetical protein [Synechococcaceae cyanobacterium]
MQPDDVRALLQVPSIQGLAQRYVNARLRSTLETSLRIAHLASLHQNEGRNLRFALAFDPQPRQRTLGVHPFRHPIELTAKQLQSISAGFAPESHCLVIAPGSGSSGPVIIGTAPRPRAALPPPQLYHPPVVIDVEAPGVVALSIGEARAVFRRGEIHEPSRGIPGLSPIRETERLVEEVCAPRSCRELFLLPEGQGRIPIDPRRWQAHGREIRAIATRSARRMADRTLQTIARQMVRARRGGAILLLPPASDREGLFHAGRWYRHPDPVLFRPLVRAVALEVVERLARNGTWLVGPGVHPPEPGSPVSWANESIRPALRSSLASLEEACRHCADLTEADGATVLGTDFGIEGFSVKLSSQEGELPPLLAGFLETRGNRHRSMAGTIARRPGAIGLVVSQDGEITVFSHSSPHGPRHCELVL